MAKQSTSLFSERFLNPNHELKICEADYLGNELNRGTLRDIEKQLDSHYSTLDEQYFEDRANALSREGYTKCSEILPPSLLKKVTREQVRIMDETARRIDIKIDVTDDTPRKMETVNYDNILNLGEVIPHLYYSTQLRSFLCRLTRNHVYDCPYDNERMTGTRQTKIGDTHGWHWGDHEYALIFILAAPDISHGGMLQNVPHTNWNKSNPRIHQILTKHDIKSRYHASGDVYFFKTDTTLHRTYPLEKDGTRIILNFTFSGPADLLKDFSHETMNAIFDF